MTTYSGPISFLSNNASNGDGDESAFNVQVSGSISLNLTSDPSGNLTGTGSVSGAVTGSTSTDTDGDDDNFADDISGTVSGVSGLLSGGLSTSFSSSNSSFVSFQGIFSSGGEILNGTVTISDSNLGADITIPVSLAGSGDIGLSETTIPTISAPAQFQGSVDAAGNWTGESDPITFNDSTGSWALNAFKGVYDGINYVASEAKYYAGVGISALTDVATDEAAEAVENRIETVSPEAASTFSDAKEALSLYQTLKTFEDDSMNLIERGINSIEGKDDLTPEEFDAQATQIANNLQTNLISQLTGIPSSVLNVVQNYTGKITNLFGDSSPIFETYEGSGSIGGNPGYTYGIMGGSENQTLKAGAGNSVLFAGTGNDTLVVGAGNEWLIGGGGADQAVFSGKRAAYTVQQNADGSVTVSSSTGTDTLVGMAQAVFADQTLQLASDISLLDTTTGQGVPAAGTPYSGPVAGLQHQYVYTGTDNVNIAVTDDNWFLKSGPGEDAIQAHGGYNVLDGSTGSNFLTGGGGTDTFFVDDRSPPGDIWSTVNNFHQGDDATVFGIVNSPAIQWFDNQGAAGFTGLTLHVFGQNAPTASLTLVGYSSSDLSNGRLTVQFGNEADGTAFMHIIGTG